jgi:hypothetical protein
MRFAHRRLMDRRLKKGLPKHAGIGDNPIIPPHSIQPQFMRRA